MAKGNAVQLQIVDSKDGAELSISQKSFNLLTKHLEDLNSKLHVERIKLDEFLKLYNKKIPSYQDGLGKAQIATAKMLSEAIDSCKFTKSEVDSIGRAIEMILDQAFLYLEPDEEATELYNMWSTASCNDSAKEQSEILKSGLKDMIWEQMSVNMDLSDLDRNSPNAMNQFKERLKVKMEDQEGQEQKRVGEKRKTKKQREQEDKMVAEEKAQVKSLKGIYYSLVKVLHPDTASDPEEILRKGELMKRVTVAYGKKDLSTLLKLEMEWLQVESDHINKLSDEKLDLYNAVLKNQIDGLKMEWDTLPSHPRYQSIRRFAHYTPKKGKFIIKATAAYFEYELRRFEAINRDIKSKRDVLTLIKAVARM